MTAAAADTRFNAAPRADRKPRCRLLDKLSNRCPNEEVAASLCAHHIDEVLRAWRELTSSEWPDPDGLRARLRLVRNEDPHAS